MIDMLGAGVAVGLAVAMPMGPVGLTVMALGRRGWRTGAAAAAGVATADLTWAIAAVGGGAVLAANPAVGLARTGASGLLVAVGVFMVARGVHQFRQRDVQPEVAPPRKSTGRWFAALYGLTLPNPLTVAVFTAAGVEVGISGGLAPRATFAASVGLTSLAWQLALAAAGRHVLARAGPTTNAGLTAAGGLLLVVWPTLNA